MTVQQLVNAAGFSAITVSSPERQVRGVYVGDLLSWVMGRAKEDNVWITIMSNINVIAVATLADVSCILLAEGVVPDDEVLKVATEKGVNILSAPSTSYECATKLFEILR